MPHPQVLSIPSVDNNSSWFCKGGTCPHRLEDGIMESTENRSTIGGGGEGFKDSVPGMSTDQPLQGSGGVHHPHLLNDSELDS